MVLNHFATHLQLRQRFGLLGVVWLWGGPGINFVVFVYILFGVVVGGAAKRLCSTFVWFDFCWGIWTGGQKGGFRLFIKMLFQFGELGLKMFVLLLDF